MKPHSATLPQAETLGHAASLGEQKERAVAEQSSRAITEAASNVSTVLSLLLYHYGALNSQE